MSERSPAAVAFTFAQSPLPSSLLPPSSPVSFSGPSSLHSTHSPPTPSRRLDQVTNYQDVLVFTPGDGVLTLHRVFVEAERKSQDHTPSTSTPSATSGSLPGPGLSSMARLGAPGTSSSSPRKVSALTRTMEKPPSLTAHESVVATWLLRRGRDWKEVKRNVQPTSRSVSRDRAGKSRYVCSSLVLIMRVDVELTFVLVTCPRLSCPHSPVHRESSLDPSISPINSVSTHSEKTTTPCSEVTVSISPF